MLWDHGMVGRDSQVSECPICSLFVYGVLVTQNHIVWFVQSSQAGYYSVFQLGVNRAPIRGAIVTPGVVSTSER